MLEAKHVVSIDLSSIRFFSISSVLVTPASCAVAGSGAVAFGSGSDMDRNVQEANEETTDGKPLVQNASPVRT